MSSVDHIKNLLNNYNRRLQKLEEQKALQGTDTPPQLLIEIEDIKTQIDNLRENLENDKQAENIETNIKPPQIVIPAPEIGLIAGISGPSQGLRVFLTTQTREMVFGRRDCDVETKDMLMSKNHFKVTITPLDKAEKGKRDYRVELTDVNSMNGTFVNGSRVQTKSEVRSGDVIEAGGSTFEVRLLV